MKISMKLLTKSKTTKLFTAGLVTITAVSPVTDMVVPTVTNVVHAANGFAVGTGTIEDPYVITTVAELNNVRNFPSANYILHANIDLEGVNWTPIPSFSGTLEGNNHVISNLTVYKATEKAGLFEVLEKSEVKNLILTNPTVSGVASTGALFGSTKTTVASEKVIIENVHVIGGTITGTDSVGGLGGKSLVGVQLNRTSSSAKVMGLSPSSKFIGGLLGNLTGAYSSITKSYFAGEVEVLGASSTSIGGLIGSVNAGVYPTISDVFTKGKIYAPNSTKVGGVFGNLGSGDISNLYSTAAIFGKNVTGGLAGSANFREFKNGYSFNNLIKSSDASGAAFGEFSSSPDNIKETLAMPEASNQYTNTDYINKLLTSESLTQASTYESFDFKDTWMMSPNGLPIFQKLPALGSEAPVLRKQPSFVFHEGAIYGILRNAADFAGIRDGVNNKYYLENNIDMLGAPWKPISEFHGEIDGKNHTLSNMVISNEGDNTGIFGKIVAATVKNLVLSDISVSGENNVGTLAGIEDIKTASETTTIYNVHVKNANVQGGSYVGGLVGKNIGKILIENSSVKGKITGNLAASKYIGGVIGFLSVSNVSNITKSINKVYAGVEIDAVGKTAQNIGGIVGQSQKGKILNVHTSGVINAPTGNAVGGIAGYNSGDITTSYSTMTIKGSAYTGGLVGNGTATTANNVFALNSVVNGSGSSFGKLIGYTSSNTKVNNSYVYDQMKSIGHGKLITGPVSQTELLRRVTFENQNFDFGRLSGSPVWGIDEGSTLPYLTDLPYKVTPNPDGSWNEDTDFMPTKNQNPVFEEKIPTMHTTLGTSQSLDLSAFCFDPDGDKLIFEATSSDGNVGTVSMNGTIMTLSPIAKGSTAITVKAKDGKGGTASQTFSFTVMQ